MKKTLLMIFSFLLMFILVSCQNATTKSTEEKTTEKKEEYIEKLSDLNFEQGFEISGLKSTAVSYTWWQYNGKAKNNPIWQLGQYCDLSSTRAGYDSTKNDLTLPTLFDDGYGIEKTEGNTEILTNKSGSKEIKLNLDTRVLSLNIDTSKEYVDENGTLKPRVNGEDWVHMIIQQAAGGLNVSEFDEIILEMTFSVTECDVIDDSIGAAQFQWIFSIKDKDSVIGDYFWFHIQLFDSRYDECGGMELYDGGKQDSTGKFMYSPKTSRFMDEPIEVGKTYKLSVDIRPLVEEAFNKAKEKGALSESKFESMILNSFNIGWEVSNISKVGLDISNLSMKVKND